MTIIEDISNHINSNDHNKNMIAFKGDLNQILSNDSKSNYQITITAHLNDIALSVLKDNLSHTAYERRVYEAKLLDIDVGNQTHSRFAYDDIITHCFEFLKS